MLGEEKLKSTSVDVTKLKELTKHCDIFKKLTEEQGNDKIHIACCKAMKLQINNPGDLIVKYGDYTHDFYVIIEGRVGVRIPVHRARNSLLRDSSADQFKPSDPPKTPGNFKLDLRDVKFGSLFLKKLLTERIQMEEVNILSSGEVFGELSILSDKPRAATIIAKTRVVLGVLSKDSFQKLIGSFTERRLNDKIDFLQSLPIFKSWSKIFLLKVSFYFSLRRMSWNQVLFREGSPSNSIYFIKEGDIMVFSR